jgi:hypothetical protein
MIYYDMYLQETISIRLILSLENNKTSQQTFSKCQYSDTFIYNLTRNRLSCCDD